MNMCMDVIDLYVLEGILDYTLQEDNLKDWKFSKAWATAQNDCGW